MKWGGPLLPDLPFTALHLFQAYQIRVAQKDDSNPLLSTARHKLGVLGVSFNRGHPQLPHLEELGANFLGKRLTPGV